MPRRRVEQYAFNFDGDEPTVDVVPEPETEPAPVVPLSDDPFDSEPFGVQSEMTICGVVQSDAGRHAYVVAPRELNPDAIRVVSVSKTEAVRMQRLTSKAAWKPSPGRCMPYVITEGSDMIGLMFLTSPVVNMGDRDRFLGLPKDNTARAVALRHYVDMSICVGVQPLAWHWNIGKLVAMIAPTMGPEYMDRFGDEMKGVVTTSLFGRSSQYNRVYKMIGRTKGYGHEHIGEHVFRGMKAWMRRRNMATPKKGVNTKNSNTKMETITWYRKSSGDNRAGVFHGKVRGIYYHPAVDYPTDEAIRRWYARWGKPRWERTQTMVCPYPDGLAEHKEHELATA